MSITEVAIKRPLLISVVFGSLILFGILSFSKLNYNLLPKFEVNIITVFTVYPGASASEVENAVTKKIEDALASLEGLDKIFSSSQEAVSIVQLQLDAKTPVDRAQQNAQRKIDALLSQLPEGINTPVISKFSSDEVPVLRIGAYANIEAAELYDLINDKIKPQLANVAGVGEINLIGGLKREIKIYLDRDKLRLYRIPIAWVPQAIDYANKSFPAGKIENNQSQYPLRFDANIQTLEQLQNLALRTNPDGSKVLLKDVAELVDDTQDPATLNRVNGKPSIGLEIFKQTDANAVEVSHLVQERLNELEKLFAPYDLKFRVAVNQSDYTLASARAVGVDLVLAIFIVSLVMLAFLHSIRSSTFVLVALPTSMIPTFIGMYLFGFSLNLMTLMALSLVVGILVDDSIVVLENIYRHMEMGKDRRRAAIEGRLEIGFTALAITLVDVVVFFPMALASGLIGNILREFSMVVVFSTLLSLLVSFTVTPMLAARFGRLEHLSSANWWSRLHMQIEHFLFFLKVEYGKILLWALAHKKWVFGVIALLLAGSFTLPFTGFIGQAFIATGDRGELSIKLETSPQTPLSETNRIALQVEQLLLSRPEVKNVFSSIGYSSTSAGNLVANNNIAELTVKLVDKNQRALSAEAFGEEMKREIAKIPGVRASIHQFHITGQIADAAIQVGIKGTDMDSIRKAANIVKSVVMSVPGTQDVEFSVKDPKPQIDIRIHREKMAQYGISAAEVGNTVRIAFLGNDQVKFRQGGNEYTIRIILDKFDKHNPDDVRRLPFVNMQGQTFELGQFASVNENIGESTLERIDRLNAIKVNAAVVGRPTGTVGADIRELLADKKLPDGVSIEYLGDLQRQDEAFRSLGIALALGFILVYLIMVALYESVLYPFVVLFSIPVAFIGALLALALTMEDFTIFSLVGTIMLLGLVSKNAILIVDFANHIKQHTNTITEALVEAGKERLRPILMTTVAMILGMLPIALAKGSGAEIKNGMAWVLIGGLTSSMIFTLFIVPCVYLVMENLKNRFSSGKK
ncbi:MAG: multidrug ABC transporter [Chitinophagales bacterium]|nr:MAG: multidrug ABC transporter [Chitinophagales bacterium]